VGASKDATPRGRDIALKQEAAIFVRENAIDATVLRCGTNPTSREITNEDRKLIQAIPASDARLLKNIAEPPMDAS
jgi:hypothetical protein